MKLFGKKEEKKNCCCGNCSTEELKSVEVDKEAKKGTYTRYPERNELFTSQPINELLVVEFYNR